MVSSSKWADSLSISDVKKILEPYRRPFELAVCNSENYFNLGTLIRTSHNFLIKKIYGVDVKYYKKACMGAKKYEDIDLCTIDEFLNKVPNRNLVVFERRPGLKSDPLYKFKWPDNPVVVLGGEKFGIPQEILKKANYVVQIPCMGVLNDFNVATAGAIAMYDWMSKHQNV